MKYTIAALLTIATLFMPFGMTAYGAETTALDEENAKILDDADGLTFQETLQRPDGKSIVLDAQVDVQNVERVDCYQYVPMTITEQQKDALLHAYVGDRAAEGKNYERDGLFQFWALSNSSDPDDMEDIYKYSVTHARAGEHVIPDEDIFLLEYVPGFCSLYPFDSNLLGSVSESAMTTSAEDIVKNCEALVDAVRGQSQYAVDHIFAYGKDGSVPFYKVVFKQQKDGMPITGYNDFVFMVDDQQIELFTGPVFGVGESLLTEPIIPVEQAVNILRENAAQISFEAFYNLVGDNEFDKLVGDELFIGSITLEYIIMNQVDGTVQIVPAWRFSVGQTDTEMNQLRDRVVAVNAVTGEIIQGRRNFNF